MMIRNPYTGHRVLKFTKSNGEPGTINVRINGEKVDFHGAPFAPLTIEQAISLATGLVEAVEEVKAVTHEP